MCLLLLYITMPLILQVSSATAVNVSILSADFYSLMAGVYLFHFKLHWLYFLSFGFVIVGIVIYSLEPATNFGRINYFDERASISTCGDYQSADYQSNLAITPSSTMTTTTLYNPYMNNCRDSRYDMQTVNDVLTPTSVTSHCVVSVHAANDSDTLGHTEDIPRRNGSIKYIWEDQC